MGTFLASYKPALAALCMMAAAGAQAGEPIKDMNFKGKYEITWSGITLGRIYITAEEDANHYQMSIDTKTKGIGALISDAKQIVEVKGSVKDGGYVPAFYESRPQKDPDEDVVTLTYDEKGDLKTRARKKDDDPSWRPPVPTAEANTARDPITAAFMLRRTLYEAVATDKHEVSTRTYDGMRLAEMKLIRSVDARVAIMHKYRDCVNVAVRRIPINGYTPKELKKYNKGDPEIRIYFSKDAAFLPVRASAKTTIGELSMTLVELK